MKLMLIIVIMEVIKMILLKKGMTIKIIVKILYMMNLKKNNGVRYR